MPISAKNPIHPTHHTAIIAHIVRMVEIMEGLPHPPWQKRQQPPRKLVPTVHLYGLAQPEVHPDEYGNQVQLGQHAQDGDTSGRGEQIAEDVLEGAGVGCCEGDGGGVGVVLFVEGVQGGQVQGSVGEIADYLVVEEAEQHVLEDGEGAGPLLQFVPVLGLVAEGLPVGECEVDQH